MQVRCMALLTLCQPRLQCSDWLLPILLFVGVICTSVSRFHAVTLSHCPAGTLHGIIDTVSAQTDINQPMTLLRPRGRYIMLGVPPHQPTLAHTAVIWKCLIVSGSLVSTRHFHLGPVSFW